MAVAVTNGRHHSSHSFVVMACFHHSVLVSLAIFFSLSVPVLFSLNASVFRSKSHSLSNFCLYSKSWSLALSSLLARASAYVDIGYSSVSLSLSSFIFSIGIVRSKRTNAKGRGIIEVKRLMPSEKVKTLRVRKRQLRSKMQESEAMRLKSKTQYSDRNWASACETLSLLIDTYYKMDAKTQTMKLVLLLPQEKEELAKLYCNRAACRTRMWSYTDAMEDAKLAIKLCPDSAKAHLRLADAMDQLPCPISEIRSAYSTALQLAKGACPDAAKAIDRIDTQKVSVERNSLERLARWVEACGGALPGWEFREYTASYRGVHAAQRIHNGERVLYVPQCAVMTLEMVKRSDIGLKLVNCNPTSHHSYQAVFLLQEKLRGRASFWFPYIASLPASYDDFPIFWDEKQLSELQLSDTRTQLKSRLHVIHNEHAHLEKADPKMFAPFDFPSQKEFAWATLVVATRIFGFQVARHTTDGIVPLADMLNHRSPASTKWNYDDKDIGFTIHATQTISGGSPIYDTYGRKPNGMKLLCYGFAERPTLLDNGKLEYNEDNDARISLPIIGILPDTFEMPANAEALLKTRQEILGLHAKAMSRTFSFGTLQSYWDEHSTQTKALFSFARVAVSSREELEALRNEGSRASESKRTDGEEEPEPEQDEEDDEDEGIKTKAKGELDPHRILPISLENERQAVKLIGAWCKSFAVEYDKQGPTFEDDEKTLKNTDEYNKLSWPSQCCLCVRHGEKYVLRYYANLPEILAPIFRHDKETDAKKEATRIASATGEKGVSDYLRGVLIPALDRWHDATGRQAARTSRRVQRIKVRR